MAIVGPSWEEISCLLGLPRLITHYSGCSVAGSGLYLQPRAAVPEPFTSALATSAAALSLVLRQTP